MRYDNNTKEMLLTSTIGGSAALGLGGTCMTLNVHFVTLWRGRHTFESHGPILCYTRLEDSVPSILGRLRGIVFDRVSLTFEDGGHVDVHRGQQYRYQDYIMWHDPPIQG